MRLKRLARLENGLLTGIINALKSALAKNRDDKEINPVRFSDLYDFLPANWSAVNAGIGVQLTIHGIVVAWDKGQLTTDVYFDNTYFDFFVSDDHRKKINEILLASRREKDASDRDRKNKLSDRLDQHLEDMLWPD